MFRFLFGFGKFRSNFVSYWFCFLSVGFVSFWKISFRSISFRILHVPNTTQVNWSIYLILENIWLLFYISFLISDLHLMYPSKGKPVQGLRIETEVCMTRNLFMLKRNVFILRCTGFLLFFLLVYMLCTYMYN